MIRCTAHIAAGMPCPDTGTRRVRWTEHIVPGWSVTTDRIMCTYHADATRTRLEQQGAVPTIDSLVPGIVLTDEDREELRT